MKKILRVALLSLALSAVSFAQDTDTMLVYAYNLGWAAVNSGDMWFGGFTTGGDPYVYANTTVWVTVPADTPYNLAANAGLHLAGGWRNVENSGYLIQYALLKPGGGFQEWGDNDFDNTYTYGSSISGTGTGSPVAHLIDGQLRVFTAAGDSPLGYYQDTVTLTLYY
jgi:spore coat protein U-like protein